MKKLTVDGIQLGDRTDLYNVDSAISKYADNNGVYINGPGSTGFLRLQPSGVSNDRTSINMTGSSYAGGEHIIFKVATTELMRMTNAGTVGINTNNPSSAYKLDVAGKGRFVNNADTAAITLERTAATTGAYLLGIDGDGAYRLSGSSQVHQQIDDQGISYYRAYTDMTFGTGSSGTERMRLDSAGQLLFNCTSNSQTSNEGIKLVGNGRIFQVSPYSTSAQESLSMYSTGASAFRFYVDWGGTIHATSTSISGISDQRLKENIVDLETGLTEVMALKPRRFDWKNGDKTNVAGFIAQEVETVLPDLIDGFKDDTIEDAKGVRMGDMIPTLVKAIQEQQTIIDDLKARIETLENN